MNALPETGHAEVEVVRVLRQVEVEMQGLARKLATIEIVIGDVASQVTGLDPVIMHELQHIDAVRQSIEALSSFVGAVSAQTPATYVVDISTALRSVRLSAMAERLETPGAHAGDDQTAYGDFELFD